MTPPQTPGSSCPLPLHDAPSIQMAHGGGGRLMRQLIEQVFAPAFANAQLSELHDGAVIQLNGSRMAFTTDSYVVHPYRFPGGDIGSLAVHGTVNDLAMCGARPLYLSAGFILEEGFPMEELRSLVHSMQQAAKASGVVVVTGDTKVVDKGKGDGVFINTAGVGLMQHPVSIGPSSILPGDQLLINGDLGRHGIAIMAVREGLQFETVIESDSAPLADLVQALLDAKIAVHCLRDLTRGGLASALVELSTSRRLTMAIDERSIPVREDVQGACEMLGLDPLYVANEGRFVAAVAPEDADRALKLLRDHPLGKGAALIGRVTDTPQGRVTLTSAIGSTRLLDMLSGEQLPRIC